MATTRDIGSQVADWIREYRAAIDGAATDAMPQVAQAYVDQLVQNAPQPSLGHRYSRDVTRSNYRFQVSGLTAAVTNVRMRSEGAKNAPGRDEDVASYIDTGTTRTGATTARRFRERQITDAYHLHAWRRLPARLIRFYPALLTSGARRRLYG